MQNAVIVQGLGTSRYILGGYGGETTLNYSGIITQGFGVPRRLITQGFHAPISETSSGGMRRGGSSPAGRYFSQSSKGGMRTGGSPSYSIAVTVFPSGGVREGGSVPARRGLTVSSSGGARRGGVTPPVKAARPVASGGMRTSASPAYLVARSFVGRGGASFSAEARPSYVYRPPAVVAVARGGASVRGIDYSPLHSGGLARGGSLVLLVGYPTILGSGGLSLGGTPRFVDDIPISFLASLVRLTRSNANLLAALGGPRVYSTWPGKATPLPYVVIDEFIEDQPGDTLESSTYTVQFTVRGSTRDSVRVVAEALLPALDSPAQNITSTRERLLWAGGVEDYSWRRPTTSPARATKTAFGADLYTWSVQYEFNVNLAFVGA